MTATPPMPWDTTLEDRRQSDAALAIRRGLCRALRDLGFASLPELVLADGRRADIIAVGRQGDIWIFEIKSSLADFRADSKWRDYLEFCDRFHFAVGPDFPAEIIPEETGLVVADRYRAEIVREAPEARLSAARRKAVLLRFATTAALRLQTLADPLSRHDFES